jgi:hypothetical protein
MILKNNVPQMSLMENIVHNDDTVATKKTSHDRKSENWGTVIQFNISDSALNCAVYLM